MTKVYIVSTEHNIENSERTTQIEGVFADKEKAKVFILMELGVGCKIEETGCGGLDEYCWWEHYIQTDVYVRALITEYEVQ